MSQEVKQTKGKTRIHGRVDISALVEPVAEVRRIAIEVLKKYKGGFDWDNVPAEEFADAMNRHAMQLPEDPFALDPETGVPHFWACMFAGMVLELKRRKAGIPYTPIDEKLVQAPALEKQRLADYYGKPSSNSAESLSLHIGYPEDGDE